MQYNTHTNTGFEILKYLQDFWIGCCIIWRSNNNHSSLHVAHCHHQQTNTDGFKRAITFIFSKGHGRNKEKKKSFPVEKTYGDTDKTFTALEQENKEQ